MQVLKAKTRVHFHWTYHYENTTLVAHQLIWQEYVNTAWLATGQWPFRESVPRSFVIPWIHPISMENKINLKILINHPRQSPKFKTFKEPKNLFQGTNSARAV